MAGPSRRFEESTETRQQKPSQPRSEKIQAGKPKSQVEKTKDVHHDKAR